MIKTYELLKCRPDLISTTNMERHTYVNCEGSRTRDSDIELVENRTRYMYDTSKHLFTDRIVNIWNKIYQPLSLRLPR